MKNYLKNLEKELKKLKISDNEIQEILKDHLEMLGEAKEDGVTDEELTNKFGTPEDIAKQIYKDNFDAKVQGETEPKVLSEDFEGYELYKAFPVTDGLEEIQITLVSEDVIYVPYEGDSIQVFAIDLENPDKYHIALENNVFTLRNVKSGGFRIGFFKGKTPDFALKVPNHLVLNSFKLQVVSSDVEMDHISAKEFDFKSTSGDLEATNVRVEELAKLTTVSGDIEVNGLGAKQLEISLVSGDIELENAKIDKDISINTVSGDAEFENVSCDHLAVRTVSGDFEGKEVYPESVELKSVSGDIQIVNQNNDKEIVVTSKKSVSGDIRIN